MHMMMVLKAVELQQQFNSRTILICLISVVLMDAILRAHIAHHITVAEFSLIIKAFSEMCLIRDVLSEHTV